MEEEAEKKKHARLHKSFLHLSQALNKLHGHTGHGRASGSNSKPHPSASTTGATSFISSCMHPRTNSFSSGCRQQRHVAAAHHCDVENTRTLRSLRIGTSPAVVVDGSSTQEDYGDDDCQSEGVDAMPPPVTAAKAVAAGGAGVAVVTFSVGPYEDFRRSMLEMVDAHARRPDAAPAAPVVDWDFMEELLFCYLQLNDRAVHKEILRAFTDTVAALRRRRRAPWSKPPKSRRMPRPELADRETVQELPGDRTN